MVIYTFDKKNVDEGIEFLKSGRGPKEIYLEHPDSTCFLSERRFNFVRYKFENGMYLPKKHIEVPCEDIRLSGRERIAIMDIADIDKRAGEVFGNWPGGQGGGTNSELISMIMLGRMIERKKALTEQYKGHPQEVNYKEAENNIGKVNAILHSYDADGFIIVENNLVGINRGGMDRGSVQWGRDSKHELIVQPVLPCFIDF